jgi:CDGSH-type Zn-finger protein
MEPGKEYYYCTCGLSKNQPFCDGSHNTSSGLQPLLITVQEKKTYWLCGCRQSQSLPFCDGEHSKEKGIKKYNEFLLKRNTVMKQELEKSEKLVHLFGGIATVSMLFFIGSIVYFKSFK